MNVVDVHNRINDLAAERGLSSYELAKRAGLAESSLYNMLNRKTMPKIETLDKICKGLEISMSDFFIFKSEPRADGYLSESDVELLEVNRNLTEKNQKHLLVYAQGMMEAQKNNEK